MRKKRVLVYTSGTPADDIRKYVNVVFMGERYQCELVFYAGTPGERRALGAGEFSVDVPRFMEVFERLRDKYVLELR